MPASIHHPLIYPSTHISLTIIHPSIHPSTIHPSSRPSSHHSSIHFSAFIYLPVIQHPSIIPSFIHPSIHHPFNYPSIHPYLSIHLLSSSIHPSIQRAACNQAVIGLDCLLNLHPHISPSSGLQRGCKNSRRASDVRRRDVGSAVHQGRAFLFRAAFIYSWRGLVA